MAESLDFESENGLMNGDLKKEDSGKVKPRETWTHGIDFLVASVGGSVGLGNVWRFPYLCYKIGGGAFLIPYFVCMIFGSLPLFIFEVCIGQYMSAGGTQAWSMLPLFQGIGLTTTMIIFYVNCYYNVILAWAIFYMFHSFTSKLPWDSCDGWWNSPQCSTNFTRDSSTNDSSWSNNGSSWSNNGSLLSNNHSSLSNLTLVDPVVEFWEKKVLAISDGIHDMGTVKWDLALCLLLAWVVVYLCICKGIRSTGKVMYFTAFAPYVFMVIIIIRNATLPGAADGVRYYLMPNLTRLTEYSVWTDAGRQTLYSSSVCQAIALTLGSYNKFRHNNLRDSVVFAFVNSFTSLFAGFLVFTILGFMAFQQGRPIDDVAESGPGLAFIAYPKAVAQMPLSQLWSVTFFIMILLLGLDSQFIGVESFVTAWMDQFPHFLRRGRRKEIFIGIVCLILFMVGLLLVTNGGMYVFQLVDFYGSGRVLILVGFLEVLAISYFYGIRRFYDNMLMMIGHKWMKWVFPYLAVCWTVITPVLCLAILIMSLINYKELTYSRPNEAEYFYPAWALGMGWFFTATCIVWIPGFMIFRFIQFGFSKKVFKMMLVPYKLKPHQMRPQDKLEKSLKDLKEEMESNTAYNGSFI